MSVPPTAEELRPAFLCGKVLNLDLTFHWIAGSDCFWFKRESRSGEDFVLVDAKTGRQSVAADASAWTNSAMPTDCLVSPDLRCGVFARKHNLWLRDLLSGQEQQLTHDGAANFAYGEILPSVDTSQVVRSRANWEVGQPWGVLWSPDNRFVVALRQDLRSVEPRLYVAEQLPPDEDYALPHFRRVSLTRDATLPNSHLVVIDTRTAAVQPVALDLQGLNDFAAIHFMGGIVWWSVQTNGLFLLTARRGGSRYALARVDLATGETREVLHESASFNVRLNPYDYARPNVHVSSNGHEVIWYSERSGYGHLYLYDCKSGHLKRALTTGEWVVFDLLRVDEARRIAYFTAAPRSKKSDPYYRYLYRVGLDSGEPELLTPEIADHKFENAGGLAFLASAIHRTATGSSISPSGDYFVDNYSTVDQPPEYVLRRTSGEFVSRIISSDASQLRATGWRPPERIVTQAADGLTNLYGTITLPRNFDPSRKYPVIDSMYPGPQGSWTSRTFLDALTGGSIHHLQPFADAGFIVVAVDGRGTAHRSREFRDAFLGTQDVFGAADHVAAIRNLAAARPYMDLNRVGVRGQSFGGYGSLRAMLLHPEFFKVGVSATGPGDWLDFRSGINTERFFGVPSEAPEARAYYDIISNIRLASRLTGHLLLIYGGIDENVPLRNAFAVLAAFIDAGKDIDMLIMPRAAHKVAEEPYALRRSVQYFVEHLGGPSQ